MTKIQIQFASTVKVAELQEEVSELLRQVASIMKEPNETEDEWLSYTFVSDESSIANFIFEDSEFGRTLLPCWDFQLGDARLDL